MNIHSVMNEQKRDEITTKLPLTQEQKENQDCEIAVYFDAWQNDNDDISPVISIIYEIVTQLGLDYKLDNKDYFKIAGSIIEAISGRNVTGILDAFKNEDALSIVKHQKDLAKKIKDFLSISMQERGNRLVIFIDELDRCKPSYAVRLLEEIKHYLNDEKITFVFSLNLEELQHTIKHYYGDNFDACRYLDRFFDLRIDLPPADINKFYSSVGIYGSGTYEYVCKRVCKIFNFQLREISKFYTQAKISTYKLTNDEKSLSSRAEDQGKELIMLYIVPLLIGLRITDIAKYYAFISGDNSEPLHMLFDDKDFEYYPIKFLVNDDESLEIIEGKKLLLKKN